MAGAALAGAVLTGGVATMPAQAATETIGESREEMLERQRRADDQRRRDQMEADFDRLRDAVTGALPDTLDRVAKGISR